MVTKLNSIHEGWIWSLASLMNRGVDHRRGSDPTLLWLWHRPAAAALIWPLAWELPYAMGTALKRKKKKKRCHHLTQGPWQKQMAEEGHLGGLAAWLRAVTGYPMEGCRYRMKACSTGKRREQWPLLTHFRVRVCQADAPFSTPLDMPQFRSFLF